MINPIISTSYSRPCCVCLTSEFSVPYVSKESSQLVYCAECSLVYLSSTNNVDDKFIEDATNKSVEYWSIPVFFQKHQTVFEHYFSQRLGRLKKNSPNVHSVLDIGSGYGFWVQYLRQQGFSAFGIDISKMAVEYANKTYGNISDCQRFEDYRSEEKYDAIFLCDVLEHVVSPLDFLNRVASFLNQNGVVYIQVPNVIGFKIPYGHNLGLPHHVWQFNPKCLARLLYKAGFEPLEYWTGVQGIIGVYENGGPTWLHKWQWKIAEQFKIGNRLQIIARKTK